MKFKVIKTGNIMFSTAHMTKKEFKERIQDIVSFASQFPTMDSEVELINDEDTVVYNGMVSKIGDNHYYQAL